MRVHSVLPDALTAAIDGALDGVEHVPHRGVPDLRAAELAASDPEAIALVGPYRSRAVAEALEATAPAGLPLLAPVATWVGVTRDNEPGAHDHPARGRGTVLRMVARDLVVAGRLTEEVRAAGQHAYVVAGDHEYGAQLDAQLDLVGLPRVDDPGAADFVVLCGLAGSPEVGHAASLGRPVVAFDGVQGGEPIPDCTVMLPFTPEEDPVGTSAAARAARLIADAVAGGARDRAALLMALRIAGPFDQHGDPVDPPVWLYRAAEDWSLHPDRPL